MSRGIQQSSSLLSKFFSTYSFIQIWLSYRYFQIFTLEKVTWILFESKKLGVVGSMKDVLSFVFSKFLSFSRKRERREKKSFLLHVPFTPLLLVPFAGKIRLSELEFISRLIIFN